jgi:hypothetical protein
METVINILLYMILILGVAGMFYVFYKLLAGGFKAIVKNDD